MPIGRWTDIFPIAPIDRVSDYLRLPFLYAPRLIKKSQSVFVCLFAIRAACLEAPTVLVAGSWPRMKESKLFLVG